MVIVFHQIMVNQQAVHILKNLIENKIKFYYERILFVKMLDQINKSYRNPDVFY